MITKLLEIKGFGIFQNYKQGEEANAFSKYNLIYGWNGSGKTTFGRLLRWIELPKEKPLYPQAKFKVQTTIATIDETFSAEAPSIRVFNKDFVSGNTNLEKGKTNSLLYIGKDNNDLKKEITELTDKLLGSDGNGGLKRDLQNEKIKLKALFKARDDFFTSAGQELKTFSLTTIFASPNIDKSTAEAIWREIKKGTTLDQFRLTDDDIKDKRSFIAQGARKSVIDIQIKRVKQEECEQHFSTVNHLLRENPVNNVIQRLKDNVDLAGWVQQGITLHKTHDSLKCEYCGSPIMSQRAIELADHFNQSFIEFQKRLKAQIEVLSAFQVKSISIDTTQVHSELKSKLDEYVGILEAKRAEINKEITNWIAALQEKYANPIRKDFSLSSIGTADVLSVYNYSADELSKIFVRHNELIAQFDKTAEEYKNAIFKHIVATKATIEGWDATLLDIERKKASIDTSEKSNSILTKTIEEKTRLLLDDQIAIDDINSDLHKFLSRSDISLVKNTSGEGGYLIRRNDVVAENLSEGEKTAIALVYFIAKLSEQGNDIKRNILVFDDPISSFDSNHLFSASAYITNKCEEAEQIFILTHSFWFFKLVRDWMTRRNKENELPASHFYTIKKGSIRNAESTLINYHSEYHFIFDNLLKLGNEASSLHTAYTIANYSRRLLESFNSFKTQDTSGFSGILQIANGLGVEKTDTDKVYYYVNKYSHLDRIESFENTIENIEAEGASVVAIVFKIIEKVDEVHYKNMIKVCSKT